jgi:hypothetical protein
MGRGRAKAKQVKVARQLKYSGGGVNLDQLRAEFGVGTGQRDTDDHAAYADLASRYTVDGEEDEDEDDLEDFGEDDPDDEDFGEDEIGDEDFGDDEDEDEDDTEDAYSGRASASGVHMSRATGS